MPATSARVTGLASALFQARLLADDAVTAQGGIFSRCCSDLCSGFFRACRSDESDEVINPALAGLSGPVPECALYPARPYRHRHEKDRRLCRRASRRYARIRIGGQSFKMRFQRCDHWLIGSPARSMQVDGAQIVFTGRYILTPLHMRVTKHPGDLPPAGCPSEIRDAEG